MRNGHLVKTVKTVKSAVAVAAFIAGAVLTTGTALADEAPATATAAAAGGTTVVVQTEPWD
ncbi:hypothetical protein ACVW0K_004664 [Streptomyces filamentosus]|uniref:hypothetical protein n=1 Tax=Streptomyces filamentosus TaxID=67294 RepID=UPI0038298A29